MLTRSSGKIQVLLPAFLIALSLASACGTDSKLDTEGDGTPETSETGIPVTIFMHSEDSSHSSTPDFTSDSNTVTETKAYRSYVGFRRVLISFAKLMHDDGIAWDFQPDWNFTEGVLKYEVNPYSIPVAEADLPSISALLAESNNKNIYRYITEDLGAVIDPHSHEGNKAGDTTAYNYADVACLITATGVTPTGIVGGHVMKGTAAAPTSWQKWPRFKSAVTGSHETGCTWTATALMGGGTGSHVDEAEASGIWRPLAPPAWETGSAVNFDDYYWQNDNTSNLPAIGTYEAEDIDNLQSQISAGTLSGSELFNATQVFNHSELAELAYGDISSSNPQGKFIDSLNADTNDLGPDAAAQSFFNESVAPLIDKKEAGQVRFKTFEQLLEIWESEYKSRSNLCVLESGATTCAAVDF